MSRKQNKNISQTIPNGTIVRTRDENFQSGKDYEKPGYKNKGDYRGSIVVDSNKKDELALIRFTTSNKGRNVPEVNKSKYRPYIETKDDLGNPIKESTKFKIKRTKTGEIKNKISTKAANSMKKRSIKNPNPDSSGKTNRQKLRELKGK